MHFLLREALGTFFFLREALNLLLEEGLGFYQRGCEPSFRMYGLSEYSTLCIQ